MARDCCCAPRDADGFYLLLNRIVLDSGLEVESVAPADDDVNSVYQYLMAAAREARYERALAAPDRRRASPGDEEDVLSRRGWWIYLLALGPVALTLIHWLVEIAAPRAAATASARTAWCSPGMFQFYYLRAGIFFGCVGIFSNLFRGEMLEKTLHYYYLTPLRREVLVTGKYLAGLVTALCPVRRQRGALVSPDRPPLRPGWTITFCTVPA